MIQKYGFCFLGVDYSVPPHLLPQGSLADAQNILPTDSGLPQSRKGSSRLNSTTLGSRVTSFFEFRSGSTRARLGSYGTKIGEYTDAAGDFTDRITGLTDNKMLQWVNFAGKAICVNEGSDVPQYYQTSALKGNLAGSPPTGLTITQWANRLWFGGDATDVAKLTGSALNDPTDYTGAAATATDAVSITIGDSKDPITGLAGFFDIMLVGKKNNIYKVSGSPSTDVTTLSVKPVYTKGEDNIGFTSPWAITQVGNDLIFLDGPDIKRLSGIQEFGDLETTSIIPHFRDYLKGVVDESRLQYSQFFHYKKNQQIWVSIPTGATSHFVFVLDYRFKSETGRYSFYPMSSIDANIFGGVENNQVTDIYFGDESGFVNQLDVGLSDNGSGISSYFTNVIAGPDVNYVLRKQFQSSESFIRPTNGTALTMTPSYAIDLLDDVQVRDSSNYTTLSAEDISTWKGTGTKHKRNRFFGLSGNTMALKWAHSNVAENFEFQPSLVEYSPKSRNLIV